MGLFSGLKKLAKGVFRGVGKIFKPVTNLIKKGLSKIVGKKWAKILMTGAAVFTAGTALVAGAQMFSQTASGFLTKFVAGAKEFVAALAHPIQGAKSILPGGGSLTGPGGALTTGGISQTAAAQGRPELPAVSNPSPEGLIETGSATSNAAAANAASNVPTMPEVVVTGKPVGAASVNAPLAAAPAAPAISAPGVSMPVEPVSGGLMSKAASGLWDFAKTPGGGILIGSVLSGMGQAAMQKDILKRQDKLSGPFTDQQMGLMRTAVNTVPRMDGLASRARRLSDYLDHRPFGSRPAETLSPEELVNYATEPGG